MATHISVLMHDLKEIRQSAATDDGTLQFRTKDGGTLNVMFLDQRLVERLIEAFHDYDNWLSGQETAPVQDYASAIADLPRQLAEAAKLK